MKADPLARARAWPRWLCPVWGCDFSTTYGSNVGKHLRAHLWPDEWIKSELDRFFSIHEGMLKSRPKAVAVICDKCADDPCRPREVS